MVDNSIVVVAIPSQDDYVWKLSSEKVPHLTLMYLDEKLEDLDRVTEFIEHVVKTSLTKFMLDVRDRGELGDKNADVLFFDKRFNMDRLEEFRGHLMANDSIFKAYNSVDQYPIWTPHLTMGYPETPAKPDDREYPGIRWVDFDRIALWTSDYKGPEFKLNNIGDPVAAWSDTARKGELILQHFGVKGMKWGVRHDPEASGAFRARSADLEVDPGINADVKKAAVDISARMDERYGFHIGAIKLIPKDHQEYGTDTMAFVEPAARATSAVSTIYVTNGSVRARLKHAEDVGWFAKGCGNEKTLLTHEAAHALFHVNDRLKMGLLSQRLAGDSIKARDKAMHAAIKAAKKDGIDPGHLLFNVSGYAYTSGTRQELEAEMFSQYHWAPNPPRFVQVWGETLHHELGIDPTPFKEGTS